MAVLKILTYGHPVLRQKAQPVARITAKERKLIDDMIETMHEAKGVGLAANQVGVPVRIFVAHYDDKLYTLVNPKIVWKSQEKEEGIEGCLSLPNLQAVVRRHSQVKVTGKNRNGKPLTIEAEGWLARIFQHEMDHLDGVLFIDKFVEDTLHWAVPDVDEQGEPIVRHIPTTLEEVKEHFLGQRREVVSRAVR